MPQHFAVLLPFLKDAVTNVIRHVATSSHVAVISTEGGLFNNLYLICTEKL